MKINETYYTDLITRYFFAETSPEEVLELEAWVKNDPANALLFSEYQKTWKAMENTRLESSINLDHEWKEMIPKLQINKNIAHQQNSSLQKSDAGIVNRKSKILAWSLRIAATFFLIAIPAFFLYRYLNHPEEQLLMAENAIIEHTLPDGSTVTLNTGSTLSYPVRFTGPFRKVTLHGEAWFDVAHDKAKPFIVSTENVRIQVVGTSFFVNTKSVRNTKEIILSSGIVKVYYKNKPEKMAVLLPGDKAELAADGYAILKTTNNDVNFLAWKTKHIVFNNTPMNEVAALLTQVYHKTIRLSDDRLSNCTITTIFDKQSLESVLNVLKATLDIQVRNNGAAIELSGPGCHEDL